MLDALTCWGKFHIIIWSNAIAYFWCKTWPFVTRQKNLSCWVLSIYKKNPSEIAILGYDLVGLIYYLLFKNDFQIDDNLFSKENKFKGITGIFQISDQKINHILAFYRVENGEFKKIF